MPLVVHCWTDLQSVHELRCYGNITRTRNVSEYMLVLALCLVFFIFFCSLREVIRVSIHICICICASVRDVSRYSHDGNDV